MTYAIVATRTSVPLLRRQKMRTPKMRSAAPPPPQPTFLIDDETTTGKDFAIFDTPSFQFEPFYRVILHYTQWVEGKPVARLVRIAVPIISMNECIRVVEMAETHNTAIVVTVKKDEAEMYVQRLLVAGLIASLEVA